MPRNSELNACLNEIAASLLQYVGECSPWSNSASSEVSEALDRLVTGQRQRVAYLADFLEHRQWAVETRPHRVDFGDLHFVSLDYLLKLIQDDQQQLIASLEQTRGVCGDDGEAAERLAEVIAGEKEAESELKELVD